MDKDKIKNLLIIDDEQINRTLIKMLINRISNNFRIFEAETGTEALNLLKNQKFDLVLLDILLPDINGLEILDKIKADKIIIISALSKDELNLKNIDLKNIEYLSKPFDIKFFQNLLMKELAK